MGVHCHTSMKIVVRQRGVLAGEPRLRRGCRPCRAAGWRSRCWGRRSAATSCRPPPGWRRAAAGWRRGPTSRRGTGRHSSSAMRHARAPLRNSSATPVKVSGAPDGGPEAFDVRQDRRGSSARPTNSAAARTEPCEVGQAQVAGSRPAGRRSGRRRRSSRARRTAICGGGWPSGEVPQHGGRGRASRAARCGERSVQTWFT